MSQPGFTPPQQPPQQQWIRVPAPPPPPPPKKPHTVRTVLITLLIVAGVFIGGRMLVGDHGLFGGLSSQSVQAQGDASSASTEAQSLSVEGGVSVPIDDSWEYADEQYCETDGGYSDIREGIQITVTNGEGNQIGYATLGGGRFVNDKCRFPFSMSLPSGEDVYSFSLSERRGQVSYQETDLYSEVELSFD